MRTVTPILAIIAIALTLNSVTADVSFEKLFECMKTHLTKNSCGEDTTCKELFDNSVDCVKKCKTNSLSNYKSCTKQCYKANDSINDSLEAFSDCVQQAIQTSTSTPTTPVINNDNQVNGSNENNASVDCKCDHCQTIEDLEDLAQCQRDCVKDCVESKTSGHILIFSLMMFGSFLIL